MNTPVNHLWNILYPMLPRFLSPDDAVKVYAALHESQRMHKQQAIELYNDYQDYLDNQFQYQCGGQSSILTFEQFYNEKYNK